MRRSKFPLVVAFAALAFPFLGDSGAAFHDISELVCESCHAMHNSRDGSAGDGDNPGGNDFLLIKSTPTDVCLTCHGDTSFGGFGNTWTASGTSQNAAGDFYFVTQNDGNGHNVISVDGGISADATLAVAPGGSYDSADLKCSQCHNPHGNSNFRLIYGVGDKPYITNPAPIGQQGLDAFSGSDADNDHNAYNSGMGAWCANCHTEFHGSSNNGGGASPFHRHPTASTDGGLFPASMVTAYGSSYVANVPFEDPDMLPDSTSGPDSANSSIMCLSCHRAHASPNDDIGRWSLLFSKRIRNEL